MAFLLLSNIEERYLKMTSLNIYRLKNVKTKKYCWIYSGYSEYERAIKAKKKRSILLEADHAFQNPDDIILDKKLGCADKYDEPTIAKIIVDDIITFAPSEVMSQRLPILYLSVIDKNTLRKFIDLMGEYPQIDFEVTETILEERSKRANEKINVLNQSTPYWQNVARSVSYLLYEIPENKKDVNYVPFDLSKVRIDQDNDIPIFYKEYYPTQFYNPNEDRNLEDKKKYASLALLYEYIRGLKYKVEDDEPLKVDGDQHEGKNNDYKRCLKSMITSRVLYMSEESLANTPNEALVRDALMIYSDQFRRLLTPFTGSIILAAIPSHNHRITNIVSRIVNELSSSDAQIINGNIFINKIKDEAEAHSLQGMEGRSQKKHEETWQSQINSQDISQYVKNLPLIIIDDLTTSGSSLKAANEYFKRMGFTNLYDFVFGKSTTSKAIIDEEAVTKSYDGLIMDLDQTFYNSAKADNSKAQYYFPDLIDKLRDKNIKFVFVTQSSKEKVEQYCQNDPEVMDNLFTVDNRYTTVRKDSISFYKPSSVTVQEAIREKLNDCNNILGVGNNEDDIMAYRRAGIDTALATWGNTIKNIISTANYVVKDEEDLFAVLEDGIKFLDRQDIFWDKHDRYMISKERMEY